MNFPSLPGAAVARGYCRVSTTKQGDDGVSLDTQKKLIMNYCQNNGIHLEKLYEDVLSGKDMNRPQLKSLLNDIKKGEYFIVVDLSRMTRNTKDGLTIVDQLQERGCKFVCMNPNFDTATPIGIAMYTILMAFHRLERQNISAHVSRNMQQLSAEGKLRSRPPYGWCFVGKDKDYEIQPEQQKVIEKIKDLYLHHGKNGKTMAYSQIAAKLDADGDNATLPLNKKNPEEEREKAMVFHAQQVKRILIDCGLVVGTGKDERIPIDKRIVSHRKNRMDERAADKAVA